MQSSPQHTRPFFYNNRIQFCRFVRRVDDLYLFDSCRAALFHVHLPEDEEPLGTLATLSPAKPMLPLASFWIDTVAIAELSLLVAGGWLEVENMDVRLLYI